MSSVQDNTSCELHLQIDIAVDVLERLLKCRSQDQ
jgi:hypothetical protein